MATTQGRLGRVVALHRYPVKSMKGEGVDAVDVVERGVVGDRAWALVDRQTGHVVSGKRPRKWAGIMDYEAEFVSPPTTTDPAPPVRIRLPDGAEVASLDGADAERRLSAALGAELALTSIPPAGAAFEYHWPDMEGLVHKGRVYRDEITSHEMPPGTFFDSSTLLILTTAGLERLRELAPSSDFDLRRFRPNIVVEAEAGAEGFVENDWVGRTLEIGGTRIEVLEPCLRCVMVTSEQAGLPKDPGVIRAVFDHNQGNVGVKGAVARGGRIRVGDAVSIG